MTLGLHPCPPLRRFSAAQARGPSAVPAKARSTRQIEQTDGSSTEKPKELTMEVWREADKRAHEGPIARPEIHGPLHVQPTLRVGNEGDLLGR